MHVISYETRGKKLLALLEVNFFVGKFNENSKATQFQNSGSSDFFELIPESQIQFDT